MNSDGIGVSSGPRRATVLLLDDDPSFPNRARAALQSEWFSLQWATTVDQAERAISRHGIDLALVAITPGDSTGWDLIESIRSTNGQRDIPIVVIAESAAQLDQTRALRVRADRVLLKPVSPAALQRVVREILAAHDEEWWHLAVESGSQTRLRELLFDPTTELPTIAYVVEELRKIIERGDTLQVFCVEIEPLFSLGERKFWDSFDEVRREFVRGLQIVSSSLLGNDVIIATSHPGANDFYCFAPHAPTMSAALAARELEAQGRALLGRISAEPSMTNEIAVFAGGASTQRQPLYAPRILYTAVREAKDIAERRETRYFQLLHERLLGTIRERVITTHFQPIFDLPTRKAVGFEALSRGPAGGDFESPDVIFGLARDFGLVWELEMLCIENVQPLLSDLCSRGLLFFNLEASFIQELQERGTESLRPFLECEQRVVVEVTERTAIRDYRAFRNTLRDLKTMGFKVAIDDCGSGYATLEAIAELRPDYLKVGQSLFHTVEHDPVCRRLVDLVARCGESIGAAVVAEAVETPGQLAICEELGIRLGQGYLLGRPAPWDEVRNTPVLDCRSGTTT